ncbi:hypothetical protein SAMN05421788_104208 [Filimonas lacunae]|uniref:Uncharacterized protein n=1 Tax=Filimonas lacunae TaxID=477680 RepID=A0A1N7PZU4_9BACT|nr:hypothetical protein [Filimonas lacunae]SIT15959.1 hypothetical protein SAMN05421788_104208 [Filimonas lacunae]
MRLSDFIMLNEAEKKIAVLKEGILIAKRSEISYMVFLFQLDRYYVEAYCNPENKAIEEYVAFGNTTWLTPYLESIHIDHLLE